MPNDVPMTGASSTADEVPEGSKTRRRRSSTAAWACRTTWNGSSTRTLQVVLTLVLGVRLVELLPGRLLHVVTDPGGADTQLSHALRNASANSSWRRSQTQFHPGGESGPRQQSPAALVTLVPEAVTAAAIGLHSDRGKRALCGSIPIVITDYLLAL